MDTKEKITLEAIQGMLQKMMAQREDMRSESQKVHERFELGTPIRARDTKHILFNDLEEEAVEEGYTCGNKRKSKNGKLRSIKMKVPAS